MKGNEKLLKTLNSLLSEELTAINQYMVHSEMSANWGYEKLHKHFEKLAIGADASKQLANDHALEMAAIKAYNDAIQLAGEVGDFATREILEHILQDEDAHIDRIEELRDQIGHMTLPIFLTTQVG